jgi:N-methylhydantoinase A
LSDRFHRAYLDRYGHSNPEEEVEFVNLRVSAIGVLPKGQVQAIGGDSGTQAVPVAQGQAYFGGAWLDTNIFMRDRLLPGQGFAGPAIVLESSCTTVMPPGCRAEIDAYGNIEIVVAL